MPSAAATKSRPKASPQKVTAQKVAHARAAEPVLVKGRRDFFKYRDSASPTPARARCAPRSCRRARA